MEPNIPSQPPVPETQTPLIQPIQNIQMAPQSSNKKWIAIIILIVILLIIFTGGAYILGKSQSSIPKEIVQTTTQINPTATHSVSPTQSQQSDITSLFNTIYQQFKAERSSFIAEPTQSSKNNTWWISSEGWSILVPSEQTITAKIHANNTQAPIISDYANLNSIVKQQMDVNGFTLNKQNSSTGFLQQNFYDYIQAYEKPGEKCVANSNAELMSMSKSEPMSKQFTFSCFTDAQLQTAYNEQIPFLKVLNERNSVISSLKVTGDKAQMSLNGRRSGGMVFMYKSVNDWKIIVKGTQQVPLCSELQANNVPLQYWIDCYDGSTLKKGSF